MFTSFDQLKICFARGIHSVGTIKANRSGLPKKTKGRQPKRARGDHVTKRTRFDDQDVYLTEWWDKKPVKILHSVPSYKGTCERQVRDSNGAWTVQTFPRPTAISLYNEGMGGTDLGDQHVQVYRPRIKTVTWMHRIFTHFLNVAVVNTFLLCKHSGRTEPAITHLKLLKKA